MNILALDPSLSATGWAVHASTVTDSGVWVPANRGSQRLADMYDATVVITEHIELVVIEGYSYNSRNSQAHSLGELGGVIRLAIEHRDIPLVVLSPAVRCKLATGKGNAGKNEVLAAAIKRLGYDGHDDNEADALWLLEAALQHYGLSKVALPASHLMALDKVEWPELAVAA